MKPTAHSAGFNVVLCLFLATSVFAQTTPNWRNLEPGKDYRPGMVALKFKTEFHSLFNEKEILDPEIAEICASAGNYQFRVLFPNHEPRPGERVDLSGWVELRFDPSVSVPALIDLFYKTDKLLCAEPRILYRTTGAPVSPPSYTPNDSLLGTQWNLPQIQAFEGWDVAQGDTSVVIAIIDTGVDYVHPDLADKIAKNYADPVNGVDDDGNGYVDDYLGWDFGDNDNNPMDGSVHGTAVSGIAAAASDNYIGIAAPGFNSRILIVKVIEDNGNGLFINVDEALLYAADRGCKVINNSWGGGPYALSTYDVIQYAIHIKDAMVLAAAGNGGSETTFYPASYDGVVSVGGTVQGDLKYDFSNYGSTVDLAAPTLIPATLPGAQYSIFDGTSSSTPMASGVAALIRAQFPQYTGLQASEQLRMTCDNIDAINPDYAEKLGRGRINMYRALIETGMPSVRCDKPVFTDNNDNIFETGDTLRLSSDFINYLAHASNLMVTASTTSLAVSFLNGTVNIGTLATMDTFHNQLTPFQFIVTDDGSFDEVVEIRLVFSADGNYSDFQRLPPVIVNRTYKNLDINQLKTTVTAKGRLGFNDDLETQGIGVVYEPTGSLAYFSIGLMMGRNIARLSSGAWLNVLNYDDDFKIVQGVREVADGLADQHLQCFFNDSLAGNAQMWLSIKQDVYAWAAAPDDRYFIVDYTIANNGVSPHNGFYVGLNYETDVVNYLANKATQDLPLKMGYTWSTEADIHTGIRLLSSTPFTIYAYDWADISGGVNMGNGFSNNEKLIAMQGNHPDAGLGTTEGGDVGLVVGTGPFDFQPGDTLRVAFAVLVGNSLTELTDAAVAAGNRYQSITSSTTETAASPVQLLLAPNPVTDELQVRLTGTDGDENAQITVFDLTGKSCPVPVEMFTNQHFKVQVKNLPPGAYVVRYATKEASVGKIFVKS